MDKGYIQKTADQIEHRNLLGIQQELIVPCTSIQQDKVLYLTKTRLDSKLRIRMEPVQSHNDNTFRQDKQHCCSAQFECLVGKRFQRYMLRQRSGLGSRIPQGRG